MLYRQKVGKIIIKKDPVAIVTENIPFMQGVRARVVMTIRSLPGVVARLLTL